MPMQENSMKLLQISFVYLQIYVISLFNGINNQYVSDVGYITVPYSPLLTIVSIVLKVYNNDNRNHL